MPRPAERAGLVFAAAGALLGLLVLAGGLGIDSGSGYDRIGPRFFPFLVAAGLLLSAAGMAAETLLIGRHAGHEPLALGSLGLLALALLLSVLLLEHLGFVLTMTGLFWLVARAFGSRRPLRDSGVGVILAVLVQFGFTRGLGLNLPAGVFGGWL